jgi:hypothetical protein
MEGFKMADNTATKTPITAQQRAALFAQSSRQNIQMLPKQSVSSGASSMQVTFPKARLLSKVLLDFTATVNIKHATLTTIPVTPFTPFMLIRRISIDLNNGFSAFTIDGRSLAMYNMVRLNPDIVLGQKNNSRGMNYVPDFVANASGADNTFKFHLELPITLNQRDPVGLILLQNESTQVNLTVDLVNGAEMFNSPSGYTVNVKNVEMLASTETFSLPAISEAFPDLSVLKLVSARTESFPGAGPSIIKMNVGTIYRKLLLYITKADGTPYTDDEINSNIELMFNQADIPYSVSPVSLAHKNESDLGFALPTGMYLFDFSNQGIPNLGGSRDYIDTEKLTEFWIRFSTTDTGKITTITECLSRLK